MSAIAATTYGMIITPLNYDAEISGALYLHPLQNVRLYLPTEFGLNRAAMPTDINQRERETTYAHPIGSQAATGC